MKYKIFPLGDSALTVDFGNRISTALNGKVLTLADYFRENPFDGLIETVPAYSSLTIFYNVIAVRKNFPEFAKAFDAVKYFTKRALKNLPKSENKNFRLVRIPVCYDKEFAPDLEFVAGANNLTIEEAIKIHTGKIYRVFMVGFLPGFAYLGETDERIAAPRKQVPRTRVEKGSVGIAGRQTGIYPFASPGGWQIIGRTDVELFTPDAEPPTHLQAGDAVQFYESDFSR